MTTSLSRRFAGLAVFLALASSPLRAQEDLRARLERTAKGSQLDAEGVKPWHMKLEVQMFEAKGNTVDRVVTVEEWWAGPQKYKRTYTGYYNGTEIRNADGLYRAGDPSGIPYQVEVMRNEVAHPMHEEDLREGVPDRRKEKLGGADMDCIMLSRPVKNIAYPPLGLFPTYCLNRDKETLRARFELGAQLSARNRVGKFQGIEVGVDVSNSENNVTVAKAHVVELATFFPADTMFVADAGMRKINERATKISSAVIAGIKTGGKQPVYPVEAKQAHLSGSVILRALIGREGRVHSLQVMNAPDPSLAISSLAAVRTWTYQPYILNGEAVDVDTTIIVNYNLSSY